MKAPASDKPRFGTKAETLRSVAACLQHAQVPLFTYFSVAEWAQSRDSILESCAQQLPCETVIVRSSALSEDSELGSRAGEFVTVPGVKVGNAVALSAAIDQVVGSFKDGDGNNQVIVQQQIVDLAVSGVAFTRDLATLGPYVTINFDDETGSHDSVTGGFGERLKTYVHFRESTIAPHDPRLLPIFSLLAELEELFGNDALDVEFGVDSKNTVYLLQVRPIVSSSARPTYADDLAIGKCLFKIEKKVSKLSAPHPGLYGHSGLFSNMTDWNPAEMIGVRPRPLALSLYKELITDETWAYQRDNYGYKNLRSYPLLLSFMGLPYIDVRVSLNSFIPKSLPEDLSHKLADYYLSRLREIPALHDKVEFDIVFSCYFPGLNDRLRPLLARGFTELELDRIKFALLELTNRIISPVNGIYQQDLARVEYLGTRYHEVMAQDLPLIHRIYWLLQDCRRYGTLPFAGLARAGFIAVQTLNALEETGVFAKEDIQAFLNSLDTVGRKLSRASSLLRDGRLSRESFLSEYGHLRPGTYDLLSPRYDEAFDLYFSSDSGSHHHDEPAHFELTAAQEEGISFHLRQNGLQLTSRALLGFLKQAIEGRELGKFYFTRSLSELLRQCELLGESQGFSKEEMTFLDIQTVLFQYSNLLPEDLRDIFGRQISANRESYEISQRIRLPQLIASSADVYSFYLGASEPNFVTLERATAEVVTEEELLTKDLAGKIIAIRGADPGYDWIFARSIGGLITMYGGANSHMAIRCAELRIPAIIGCGEQLFSRWSSASRLEIDCASKQVRCPE